MKKWYLLIIATMLAAGTAQAGCGSCGEHAEEAKKKAACEMKAAEKKAECAATKAKCSAEKTAECAEKTAECAKEKAECATKAAEKKCCGTCKGEKKGKKWYNPVSWF